MTSQELAELNHLNIEIKTLREKFKYIESAMHYIDDDKGNKRLCGKLALCKIYVGNSFGCNEILVEFDREMQMAVLQELNRKISILENKFNNLTIKNVGCE